MKYGPMPLWRRVLGALGALVANVVLWILLPLYLGNLVQKELPTSAITNQTFVIEFGIVITALAVAAAITSGKAISIPFRSASSLLMAYYLWAAFNGGNFEVATSGVAVNIEFTLLLYFLMLPSLWGAVKAPLEYMARPKPPAGPVPTVS